MSDNETLWEEKLKVIAGDGLHELINDMIDNLADHAYINLRALLEDCKLKEFKDRLNEALMNEWETQARERLRG